MSLIWLNSLCPFINVGRGRDGNSASALSNTRCRQMVPKIFIFWKWILPWLCLISAFQTPTSYKWNDTCPFAFYAVNRVLRFGFWQSEFGFQIVKVPVFRHNNLLQNPTYFTLLEVIYLLSKVQIKYQDASIIVLAVDVLDQSLCVAERPYTKWALSSLSFQNSMKYGMKEEQLISYTAWHTACVDFFTNVLTIDEGQLSTAKTVDPGQASWSLMELQWGSWSLSWIDAKVWWRKISATKAMLS